MAAEKDVAAGGGAESSLTNSQVILGRMASIPRIIVSKLRPPPPLLPVANADVHPINQNLQNLELGKLAFTVATTATLGLLFSHNFPAAEAHYFVVVGFMGACAVLWNGILFGKTSLQVFGITLTLLSLYILVGSFLPLSFSWACWLLAVFSLIPFLSLLLQPHPVE